jgi:hypothetical protein
MAKGKFFRNLWQGVKRFFGLSKGAAQKYIPVGIQVVEQIKLIIDSPVMPLLNMLIPGQLDDALAAKVKQLLPQILATLKVANDCANKPTADEVVQCAISYLRTLRPNEQEEHWLKIAAKLSAALSDGVLQWTEILDITQDIYLEKYKK